MRFRARAALAVGGAVADRVGHAEISELRSCRQCRCRSQRRRTLQPSAARCNPIRGALVVVGLVRRGARLRHVGAGGQGNVEDCALVHHINAADGVLARAVRGAILPDLAGLRDSKYTVLRDFAVGGCANFQIFRI